ncbi:MAG: inverse autotransporter beta domain-containing protein [Candidatus Adiutrix sp.]|jgi:hypothetical protein|nr:inverse autotransporter beta domain-containing protein [Candidatus Adiutrix sp.]
MTAVAAKFWKIVFLAVLTLPLALGLPLPSSAGEATTLTAPVFELPPARGAVDWPEPSAFGLDTALGLAALPEMSGGPGDGESTYEKAWRMQDGPGGTTRLTYGERYRRNPDGSYGAQSSSPWRGLDHVADRLLGRALSAGSGYFSSWAEGWLGGYGQARVSVRVNGEGDVSGSGDFLYPIYDRQRTTFFTQLGLRTVSDDRLIGNFGLGQRFLPSENFALGYNVFIDQDFSRNHSRGGAGVEAWYDWLRLSANYYTPLSGWKDSKDYDSNLVEERPAEGYDARLTGYLPFYRNLAVTGAFEKWKGEHVGAFGTDDFLQKDPKVWSYGLEWTPVPAFSTSVNQRHSGSRKETQFGLTFNYHFGMDWEDQLSPAVVTEMRTVDGSRHDFVNRRNEIILAYRAKAGAAGGGGISQLQVGLNILIRNANGDWVNFATNSFTSAPFVAGPDYFSTVELKVVEVAAGCDNLACATEPAPGDVRWQVTDLRFSGGATPVWTPVWWKRLADAENGLYWGDSTAILLDPETHTGANAVIKNSASSSYTDATVELTDIVGSRSVTVSVSVSSSLSPDVSKSFAFGDGPLSAFTTDPDGGTGKAWALKSMFTDFGGNNPIDFQAADAVGGSVNNSGFTYIDSPPNCQVDSWPSPGWSDTGEIVSGYGPVVSSVHYSTTSKLPGTLQLLAVAKVSGKGAAFAANWPDGTLGGKNYWSGEVFLEGFGGTFRARVVNLSNGAYSWPFLYQSWPVAVGAIGVLP